ncbi:MAG: sulfur carrier protein ThiS [Bacteroidales bacterium]|nr:sulfur carrier protein ThiS [Bacteroidales bacterium]
MKITLNNRIELFEQNKITISELLKLKKFTFKMLVIKVNGELVKKNNYNTFEINDGDNITVLHLVSGG